MNPRVATACLLALSAAYCVVARGASPPMIPPTGVQKLVAGGVTYAASPPEPTDLTARDNSEFVLAPMRVPMRDLPLNLEFGATPAAEPKPMRVRYQLRGWDGGWRDMEGQMWLVLRFLDERGQAVSSASFIRQGESRGWRGEPASSEFHTATDFAVVPPRTQRLQVLLVSGGTPRTTGVWLIRRLQITAVANEHSADTGELVLEVHALDGAQLESPQGVPRGWSRDGTSLDTPQILLAGSPPAPVLALRDRDPSNTGGWLARAPNVVRVTPGTTLRVVCEELYSIGRGGDYIQSYHNLRPGRYDFLVQGVDELGRPVGAGTRLPLVIVPPLLQAVWFRSVLAVILVVGLIGGVRYATWRKAHRQLEQLERERAVEAERTRIARDLHDEMGSRLTQISLLAARAAQSANASHTAAEPLAQMQRAAHALASTLDEIVWATNPQHDTLPALGDHLSHYAVEALAAGSVRCRLEVPTSLPNVPLSSGDRFRLMMAVKEALTNVLKHASATEARVRLAVGDGTIELSIQDNGVGLRKDDGAQRNGLRNMRERLAEIGGDCEILTLAEGGTLVWLRVPLRAEVVA